MPKTTSLPKLSNIITDFPDINFEKADIFYWSAKDNTVYFESASLRTEKGLWQLLHEVSHAVLGHKNFNSSISLLKMETEAWAKAKQISEKYQLTINHTYVERCLDTYRDWLHKRSTCPGCSSLGIEADDCLFSCFNCGKKWQAGSSQLSRCYRRQKVNATS